MISNIKRLIWCNIAATKNLNGRLSIVGLRLDRDGFDPYSGHVSSVHQYLSDCI